ncbi:LuxR family transcriptional regulator [Chitinimonas arctica]|uniref:LuxR family transcriptional regulator n=1 Tax=Chitinimonas arctica TaxID=2594795 RepID=A0A516SBF5_9NEIS|nr:LuxR family transcriptional regulator [Chitinimonas arctica]QDQ25481.1 LuxR family transcriptional regulator [Chitinimonas arctica]
MENWRERYTAHLSQARSEQELFQSVAGIARELGFEHSSYGLRAPLPVSAPRFSLFSDYPISWAEHYIANDYFAIDPTVHHGLQQTSSMVWSADHPQSQPQFWEEARLHHLSHGWCMPTRGKYATVGLLSLVRSAERVSQAEMDEKETRLMWLAVAAHGCMVDFLAPKLMPESTQELTPREREILKWTAAGKTYIEIGMILAIDDRTVKFHLGNAMRKMQATNKTGAAIKASLLGMLY